MALVVLTVEADGTVNSPDFPRRVASSSRTERLYIVTLQVDLQQFIVVQDGFVCVADLELLIDHPPDLPCREKACSCCAALHAAEVRDHGGSTAACCWHAWVTSIPWPSSGNHPLFSDQKLRSLSARWPSDRIRHLQISNRLLGFNFVDPYHCFSRTTWTQGYLTPEITLPNPEVSAIRPRFEPKFFGFLCSGKLCLSPLVLAPPPEHQNCLVRLGITRTCCNF